MQPKAHIGPGYKVPEAALRPRAVKARPERPAEAAASCELAHARAASSATREPASQPPAQAPPRPGEREVRDGREPRLVGAQRQQQVRDPVARGQRAIGRLHAIAVDAPAARSDEDRAGLAEQPGPEPTTLEHEPAAAVQLPRARRRSGRRAAAGRAAPARVPGPAPVRTTSAPRAAYSSGIIHACASTTTRRAP